MDDTLKTSQQKRGEHQLAEGGASGSSGGSTEGSAPGEFKTTSGKLSLAEGE